MKLSFGRSMIINLALDHILNAVAAIISRNFKILMRITKN